MVASPRPKRVAVVGGIGAGKSTVAKRLAELGASVIDGDAIGHQALTVPKIHNAIVAEFGSNIINSQGNIDRKKLSSIVFADPEALKRLQAIMYPYMKASFQRQIDEAEKSGETPLIVVDAAVLLESGWNDLVDEIIYVHADPERRAQRVAARGWSAEEWARRESVQWPLERKRALANHVVDCDDWDVCRKQVDALFHTLTATEPSSASGV
jgi:dephospho-CoA kinase